MDNHIEYFFSYSKQFYRKLLLKNTSLNNENNKKKYTVKNLVIETLEKSKPMDLRNIVKKCILNMNRKYKLGISNAQINRFIN